MLTFIFAFKFPILLLENSIDRCSSDQSTIRFSVPGEEDLRTLQPDGTGAVSPEFGYRTWRIVAFWMGKISYSQAVNQKKVCLAQKSILHEPFRFLDNAAIDPEAPFSLFPESVLSVPVPFSANFGTEKQPNWTKLAREGRKIALDSLSSANVHADAFLDMLTHSLCLGAFRKFWNILNTIFRIF